MGRNRKPVGWVERLRNPSACFAHVMRRWVSRSPSSGAHSRDPLAPPILRGYLLDPPDGSTDLPDGQIAHVGHTQTARRAIPPQAASIDLSRKSAAHSPRPAPDKRGASRSSRTLGAGCDGRRRCQLTSDVAGGRRSRVVLTPRRWSQAGGGNFAGDGGKKARSPGRARYKR